jgi:MFS family permease
MLSPVLPLFLTRDLAAPASAVGIVEGIAQATQNIVQGGSGWLADRLGRNKPVALVGYAVAALSKPSIGLATVWPHVLAARFADRLGTGVRSAPRDALIAGSVDTSRRGAAFGLEGVGDNLGAVLGPLLTAALLYLAHLQFRTLFLLAFVPGAIAFALISAVREVPRGTTGTELAVRGLPPPYWRYLAAIGVFGLGNLSSAFVILKSSAVGIGPEQTLFVYAGYNFVAALASYPAGGLSDRLGRKRVLLVGLAVLVIAFGGFASTASAVVVAALFVLYGVYQGVFRAVGKALATDLAPKSSRGSAVGLYGTVVGLSALLASAIAGQLWDRFGPGAAFGYAVACAIGGIALISVLVPSRLSPR